MVNIDYYKTLSVVLYLLGAFENNLYPSSYNRNSTQWSIWSIWVQLSGWLLSGRGWSDCFWKVFWGFKISKEYCQNKQKVLFGKDVLCARIVLHGQVRKIYLWASTVAPHNLSAFLFAWQWRKQKQKQQKKDFFLLSTFHRQPMYCCVLWFSIIDLQSEQILVKIDTCFN